MKENQPARDDYADLARRLGFDEAANLNIDLYCLVLDGVDRRIDDRQSLSRRQR